VNAELNIIGSATIKRSTETILGLRRFPML
jgi:hypothetical protein